VPEAVQRARRQLGGLPAHLKRLRDGTRVERRSVLASEDEAVVLVGVAPGGPLDVLSGLVCAQGPDRARVKPETPEAGLGLRRQEREPARERDELPLDSRPASIEVERIPRQSEALAPPRPRDRKETP
jgi:hypothetical protein